jgi:ParB-like chromosome segregation protein Spo0J
MTTFTIHPLAEKFPAMPPADYEKLKESIAKYGLFEPIVINEAGQLLEGRHRYKALLELGKDPKVLLDSLPRREGAEHRPDRGAVYL